MHPQLLELMRLDSTPADPTNIPDEAIFIERATKYRGIENGEDVKKILKSFGIKSRALGTENLTDQISAWKGAKLIISTLGSDLTNIIFANANADVLSLTPEGFGDKFFFELAALKNVFWNELFCGGSALSGGADQFSGFQVDCHIFKNMISNLIRAR